MSQGVGGESGDVRILKVDWGISLTADVLKVTLAFLCGSCGGRVVGHRSWGCHRKTYVTYCRLRNN